MYTCVCVKIHGAIRTVRKFSVLRTHAGSMSTEPAHTLRLSLGNNAETVTVQCRFTIRWWYTPCFFVFERWRVPATCAVYLSSWLLQLQQLQQPVPVHLPSTLLPVATNWKTSVPPYFGYMLQIAIKTASVDLKLRAVYPHLFGHMETLVAPLRIRVSVRTQGDRPLLWYTLILCTSFIFKICDPS